MKATIFILLLVVGGAIALEAQYLRHERALALVERRLALATQENERLRTLVQKAETEREQEKNRVWREKIEREVEEIRGLKFLRPVEYEVVTREAVKSVLAKKLTELMTESEFTEIGRAYARLGVLPEGYPLRQSYLDLLSEQVAAFYDQHRGKLVMFAGASLENGQNRVILAHELTHALQDQHFQLLKLPLESKENDDRAVAASALVEGDATLVMSQYQLKNISLQALRETVSATVGQSMAQLEKAPRFLRELLIFPYLRGQEFCSFLTMRGGFAALDAAYGKLPQSSAEILHPQLYPQPSVDGAEPEIFDGEKAAVVNTLGEIGTRLQLLAGGDEKRAEEAAEGWRGDRYYSFPKHDALVWKTQWADAKEAAEFLAAERAVLRARYKPATAREDETTFSADAPRVLRLVQTGPGVVTLVDAGTVQVVEQLQADYMPAAKE